MRSWSEPESDLVFRSHLEPAAGASTLIDPSSVVVRLGARWRDGYATRLLDGLRDAVRRGAPLTLVHEGAGGGSLLLAAETEFPDLRVEERIASARAALRRPDRLRWSHVRMAPPQSRDEPTGIAISGGLGGIGLRLAQQLAAAGHRLWLVDRRGIADLDEAAATALAELCARTRITVSQLDVVRDAVPAPPFPVTRLAHVAGELELIGLADVDADDLERIARSKATGLASLVDALAPRGLRSVVVFGSVESRAPHPMFGGYALANELVRLAASRAAAEHPSVRFVTAEFSLWSEVGMAAQSAELAAAAGYATVSPAWGAAVTELLLDERVPAPADVALGGTFPTRDRPVAAVPGVGGCTLTPDPEAVRQLVRRCGGSGRDHLAVSGTGRAGARALVDGDVVHSWTADRWGWRRMAGEPVA